MTLRKPLLAAVLLLATASAARAESTTLSDTTPSTRTQRRFALASFQAILPAGVVGIHAQYHLTDRLAVTGQLGAGMMLVPALGASAGLRFILSPGPRSSLFVETSGQFLTVFGDQVAGGAAELGYQFRATSGFLFEVSGGPMVVRATEPDPNRHHPPVSPKEGPWHTGATFSLRFGYAF